YSSNTIGSWLDDCRVLPMLTLRTDVDCLLRPHLLIRCTVLSTYATCNTFPRLHCWSPVLPAAGSAERRPSKPPSLWRGWGDRIHLPRSFGSMERDRWISLHPPASSFLDRSDFGPPVDNRTQHRTQYGGMSGASQN